jgi:putative two-component system response regulator
MERHTIIGHEIFAHFKSELSRIAAAIALTHHERYDGNGYPHGLAGNDIPLEGRITAVADVFDALLSDRSYRPALSLDEAAAVMRQGRGTHFDPQIVDILLGHIDEALTARG